MLTRRHLGEVMRREEQFHGKRTTASQIYFEHVYSQAGDRQRVSKGAFDKLDSVARGLNEDQRQQEIIKSKDWKKASEEDVYEGLRMAILVNQKQVIDHLGKILFDAVQEPLRKFLLKRYRKKFEAANIDAEAAADDVLTQTWLKALSKRSSYRRKRGKIRTWLHRVASTTAIDLLRRESRVGRSKTFDIDTPLGRAAARRAIKTRVPRSRRGCPA